MGILGHLVSFSEEFASQARQRFLDQRRALELLELQGDAEAVRRTQMVLLNLEQAYRIALYRLNRRGRSDLRRLTAEAPLVTVGLLVCDWRLVTTASDSSKLWTVSFG